jgi:hypothetical protein
MHRNYKSGKFTSNKISNKKIEDEKKNEKKFKIKSNNKYDYKFEILS